MVDTKQLDAVLAEWHDATTPLDGKLSVDPSFFLPSSSSTRNSESLALRSKTRTTAAVVKHEERKSKDAADEEEGALTLLRVDVEKSCRPWSHKDFLKRASSFSIGTWFAKPDAISVFACARHGWVNTTQPDQLYCPCCEQYLCFKIDPKLSEKGVLQVASAFAKLLATGHSSLCPWRENPSPEAFTTLPIASSEQVLASLEKRIEQFLANCSGDSHTTSELFDVTSTLRIDAHVMAKILQEASASEASSLSVETLEKVLVAKFEDLTDANAHEASSKDTISAFLLHVALLSVCGWQLEQQQLQQQEAGAVAWCETCNRRWSMSSFAALPPSDRSAVEADADNACVERDAKRQKVAHPLALDLVAQHRWFCPWVAARKQEASHELGVMSDELAKYGENDAKLWEFMLLPGWKQNAQVLRLLLTASSSAVTKSKTNGTSEKGAPDTKQTAAKPEQALESVRAVLGLPGW